MMEFKKINKWTKKEKEELNNSFLKFNLSTKKHSTIQLIKNDMKKKGYDRTKSSISRKLFRLGLKRYTVENEDKTEHICMDCKKPYLRPNRYKHTTYCDECLNKHKNDNYVNYKRYQKEYRKKYKER